MSNPSSPETELLQSILEPLLEDVRYWLGRSLDLFESQRLDFISETEQSNLVARVKNALKEVEAAKMLYEVTSKQVGIEISAMMPWHNLLLECQSIGMRYHQNKAN
ncbi:MAG: DUF2605 domain-containing protein [Pseudanabaena sp. CRU_2_10]|nr:DUF2605 domain-containing protein [Pseudanabaena sp. CRU_2_10]